MLGGAFARGFGEPEVMVCDSDVSRLPGRGGFPVIWFSSSTISLVLIDLAAGMLNRMLGVAISAVIDVEV